MFTAGRGLPLPLQGAERESALLDLALRWCSLDFNPASRLTMQQWADSRDFPRLEKALLPRINFGTSGLRAQMAPGYAYMNFVTVQQAAQGLIQYLGQVHGVDRLREVGVVMGYDGRHNSKEYAELSAAVFHTQHIPVYLFSRFVITPLVPYTVVKKGLLAGIMVTASHNPKQDNGYKVYWANGASIIPPHDVGISEAIMQNLDLWPLQGHQNCAFEAIRADCQRDITEEMMAGYVEDSCRSYSRRGATNSQAPRVAYTPMHGVGLEIFLRIMEKYGFPAPLVVEEQKNPDPEFPTVPFPNPEEGEGALKLAMQTADSAGLKLIIANDPDADRLAIAEKQLDGHWYIFTGDEIAILLANWLIENRDMGKKWVIVASTVSSKFVKAMCVAEGIRFEEVLTGFKWITNKCLEAETQGYSALFSFEEAIGFCVGDLVKDKDGVTAGAVFYEMYSAKAASTTLLSLLDALKTRYGYYMTKNKYFICHDPPTIKRIFAAIRGNGEYPRACGRFPIRYVRDLTLGYDSEQQDKRPVLPVSASSEMLTFTFENGAIVTLRTSGTEPKIKYYCEFHAETKDAAVRELDELVDCLIETFLQPDQYGLIRPS